MLYIFLLLIVPSIAFEVSAIYIFHSPNEIRYEWLHSPVSFLFVIPLVLYLSYLKTSWPKEAVYQVIFIVTLFVWTLMKNALGESYLLTQGYFELFYALIVANILFTVVVILLEKDASQVARFYELFMILQLAGLFAEFAVGVKVLDGRYHAPNLDTGTTGTLVGLFFIYQLAVKKTKNIYAILILLLAMLLSGSRANLMLALLFASVHWAGQIPKISFKVYKKSVWKLLLFAVLMVADSGSIVSLISSLDLERLVTMFSGSSGGIAEDDSALGRLHSMEIGLELLKENPLGLAFSFVDVQSAVQMKGYPTFPHSTLLFMLLAMGPVFLWVVWLGFKNLFRLIRRKNPYRLFLGYIILYHIVAGGAIVNFKIYFIYFVMFYLISQSMKKEKSAGVSQSY